MSSMGSSLEKAAAKVFVTVGLSGGLLDYVKLHETEDEANADGDRLAQSYGIRTLTGEDEWHDEDHDIYVNAVDRIGPERLSPGAWHFFEDVWLQGMAKV